MRRGWSREVSVRSMLEAGHLSRSDQVHLPDSGGRVTVIAEMRGDGRNVGSEDGTLGGWAPGEHGDTAWDAERILAVCRLEMGTSLDQAIECWRPARLTATLFGTGGEESVAVFVAQKEQNVRFHLLH